ncbi:putative RNA polymerase II mediator complex subunit Sin4 [Talaromyces proteolyticus]|uniref:Mediator of RNA polymerase II transcription subunit 16 n=1 Tax=Talaromyces proteolyticus TaxID=1131652 RepID=A0AAD4KQU0_9EURO|nr:putative RNA polymerase II mediator complex subunit Sin4 [Talaromyces proteolyticus]KAH8697294.1 putative RNA polymerase II mediator complex subunit Sin4 [Talaromyces proteolyticus]
MPMIMDESLDVDDLFGDPASLDLGLSAPQPTKGLAQRVDEMRLLGCCQKIAWSRMGCIAYISQDSLHVAVRHLVCQPSDGKWTLSEEYPLNQTTETHGGQFLAHICWNESGTDLAVIDTSGRISIFSISTALNNIVMSRQTVLDQADDGAQVVGMMWVNINRAVPAFNQAAKLNGRWNYSPFQRKPIGPFHPGGKPALACVTRVGTIKLIYQNPDNRWAEISAELKTTSQSDRILTHAAFLATPNGVLVAAHSLSEKISLYRLEVTWNPSHWDPNPQRQATGALAFPVPTFGITHYKTVNPGRLFTTKKSETENLAESSSSKNSLYQLTSLDIIAGQSDNTGNSFSSPWILAIYSTPIHAPNHAARPQMSPSSVMVRWQLETTNLSLHPVFEELVPKKASGQNKTKVELRRLDDISSDRYVVSVDQIEFGNVLAVTYDDSSVSFFDPRTMTSFIGMDDPNTVTSMSQAGFRYPLDVPAGLHTCFSPNGCVSIALDGEWQARLRLMEPSFDSQGDLYDENKYSAGIAALALAFGRGCASEYNTDDLLTILIRNLSPDAQNAFINEVYRALPISCNFTTEQEKLMQHQYIPRCLSVQAALGFQNHFAPRNLPSSVAWAILNLRHTSVLFAFFLGYTKTAKEHEPFDNDVLRMIYGNTKWALDFSRFILDDLFELAEEFEPVLDDQEAFVQKLKSTSSLSLTLILASMSRAFLHFICRGLRGLSTGHTALPIPGNTRMYYAELFQMINNSPVPTNIYEKFLSEVDNAIRFTYQKAGFEDNERRTPEKELLVNSRIPAVLIPAASALFKQIIPGIKAQIDQMAIYLTDYSWLGLSNDRRTEYYRRTRQVDVLKKIPLRGFMLDENGIVEPGESQQGKDQPVASSLARRRCVRCCEISGDTSTPRSALYFRMVIRMQVIRNCLCGGMWTFEAGAPAPDVPVRKVG